MTKLIAACVLIFLLVVPSIPLGQETEQATDQDLVVLIHGFGRSNMAMWRLAGRLEDAGYRVERVGYRSLDQSPEEILSVVSAQIGICCRGQGGSLHFVGHSFGGLLIRAYLERNRVSNLGKVVLIGTPNQGTDVVDRFRDHWWARLLGPTALALGTDDNSFPKSIDDPYYPVGVIAGEAGNGFNDRILPGRDDGLVPVESTKLNGMADFVLIQSGHAAMRYNKDVAAQTILFLKEGKFAESL